jgi:hypothetical protein
MKYLLMIFGFVFLTACVNTPTERTEVVDARPRLAFETSNLKEPAKQYELYIDGLLHGSLNKFQADKNALRVTEGRHLIEIKRAGSTVFSQDVYLGTNSTRVLKVTEHD